MTTSITLEAAQAQLPALIHDMASGSKVEVTVNGVAVATITREAAWPSGAGTAPLPERVPRLGGQRGSVLYMAPDFDEPLDDFKEYME